MGDADVAEGEVGVGGWEGDGCLWRHLGGRLWQDNALR